MMALPLFGCSHVPDAVNPVAWYRNLSGASKNDVEDASQRNAKNLEAGSNQPYPKLSSVPNVPTIATSTAERKKLVDSLIADRANARYNNERLQAGNQMASIAPPSSVQSGSTTPAPIAAGSPHASISATAPKATTSTAEPTESTLTSPAIPTVPKGQEPPPPPQAPSIGIRTPPPSAPAIAANEPNSPPPASKSTAPSPAVSPPENVRKGGQPALVKHTPFKASNRISVSLGDVTFTPGSAMLPGAQRKALVQIADLYTETHGEIRVVGHAESGRSSTNAMQQRISRLDLALNRANAVAQALAKLGVPADDIRVDAAPANAHDQPRVEIFMEY